MDNKQVRALMEQANLQADGIEKRLKQANFLTKANDVRSTSGNGGGVFLASSSWGRDSSDCPIVVKDVEEANVLMQNLMGDADTYQFNIPSSGVPQPMTTIWTSRQIEMLYKKRTLDLLAGGWQQGAPGVTDIKIPVKQYAGFDAAYSDLSMGGTTSVNYNWVPRQIMYREISLNYGEMQQAQFSLAKIGYVNELREANTEIVAQIQNDIGFNGFNGIPSADLPHIWGIINEPNLNSALTLPNDGVNPQTGASTTAWMGKDFLQIARDFKLIIAQAMTQAEGWATVRTPGVFGVPPSVYAALTAPNSLGDRTVLEFLNKAFPNIAFEAIPNFESAMNIVSATPGQTVGMLLLRHPNGEMPFDEIFVSKWIGHRPVAMSSSMNEKVSYGLGGAFLKYPFLVVQVFGI